MEETREVPVYAQRQKLVLDAVGRLRSGGTVREVAYSVRRFTPHYIGLTSIREILSGLELLRLVYSDRIDGGSIIWRKA